jgi:hypothetical protein
VKVIQLYVSELGRCEAVKFSACNLLRYEISVLKENSCTFFTLQDIKTKSHLFKINTAKSKR